DIEKILKGVPEKRQTLLFSATMPKRIAILAEKFMSNPETVRTKSKEMTVPSIEQHYYEVRDSKKFDILCRLLDTQSPELAIVFARTKKR
ncbi:DEAD/DEAH box helicase, partial [Staphylococcus sp. SIMBA_130]